MGRSRQPIQLDANESGCDDPEAQTRDTPSLKSRQIQLTLRSRSDVSRHSMVLDELSFATLRPKNVLQTFVDSLLRSRLVNNFLL